MAVTKTRVYTWYISLVASMCMVLYGYDASVFNAAQGSDHWLEWFDLDLKKDSNLLGLVNTSYTIGAIVSGWFLGGPVSDYLGRRWGMAIGCFLTIIATFIQAFAPWHNLGCFIGGRVLIGLGQGIALTSGPIYIGEVAPADIRGKIMTFWQMFYSVGSFIAYWIAYAVNLHRAKLGHWDWRLIVIFQILVPLIVCIVLPFQPESPRWWIQKGNVEEARKALTRIRDTEEEVEEELLTIREAVEYEKEALSGSYLDLFKDASVRKRLYIVFGLNILQQLSGQGTLNSYSSSIYKTVWASNEKINLINALNATFGIIFTLNTMWTADRYGRRWLFFVGAAGMALCMMLVPVVGMVTPDIIGDDGTATKSEPVGIAIVFLLFLFIFFYKPSWGATVWIYTAEVFSMNVRAQAVGMCSQMQNVANTIFQQFFPTFLANEGIKCLFFFMAANICMIGYTWFFVPETKKVPLEEMDALFGGQSHVTEGSGMVKGDPNVADRDSKDGEQVQQEHRENKEV